MGNWKAYPQIGNYLKVEGDEILACPMMKDGSRATDEEICSVDDWAQLYKDLLNPPEDIEQDDWKQVLIEEVGRE